MFSQQTFLALIALVTVAQAYPPLTGPYSIYNTPGPVIPQYGPDFPFGNLSSNSKEAATKISQAKLGGFCNELLASEGDNDNDTDTDTDTETDGDGKPGLAKRMLRRRGAKRFRRGTNYNSNQSSNSNQNTGSGSGTSYSSTYSNSNGRISGSESGYPGKTGHGYSYTYSNEGGKNDDNGDSSGSGSSSSSYNYTLNGLRVPKALQGYTPRAIREGCKTAMSGPPQQQEPPPQSTGPPSTPPSTAPGAPSGPQVSFDNIYFGYGTDFPISRFEKTGVPASPYVPGHFKSYRQACGNACARASACGGFVVSTDFKTNKCGLVFGRSVGRADFIDQSQAGGYEYHVEGYRKMSGDDDLS